MVLFSSAKHIDVLTYRAVLSSITILIIVLCLFHSIKELWITLGYVSVLIVGFKLGSVFAHKLWFTRKIETANKAVLITGCDTGFGFRLAQRLSKDFVVFAGCLHPEKSGGKLLQEHASNKISTFKLDVTKQDDVDAATKFVMNNLNGNDLWALVNNAGISKGSEIEMTPLSKIEEVIQVNLMGVIRMSKAFLHCIRRSRGRIVVVGSASGHFMMPGFVPYSLSKHAVLAFSEGLRLEMHKYGVSVVTIEPWIYKTRLADAKSISKHIGRQWTEGSEDAPPSYVNDYVTQLQRHTSNLFDRLSNPNIDDVIDDMEAAITTQHPNYFYRPGRWYLNAWLNLSCLLPKPVTDYIVCNYIFRNCSLDLK